MFFILTEGKFIVGRSECYNNRTRPTILATTATTAADCSESIIDIRNTLYTFIIYVLQGRTGQVGYRRTAFT